VCRQAWNGGDCLPTCRRRNANTGAMQFIRVLGSHLQGRRVYIFKFRSLSLKFRVCGRPLLFWMSDRRALPPVSDLTVQFPRLLTGFARVASATSLLAFRRNEHFLTIIPGHYFIISVLCPSPYWTLRFSELSHYK